jgi:hypothetical protein
MTTVDDLFDRFRAAYRSGEAADPRSFLDELSGSDRRELEALIDAFLERAPSEPYTPEAFARFRQRPERARLRDALDARLAETWETLLPAARNEAQITRASLVRRLAEALGVADREDRVGAYYHRMETGRLPAAGVSDRVLTALGEIVGVSAARLRAAGRTLRPEPPAAGGAVFARTAAPAPAAAPPPAPARAPAERDEVDELFTGG